MASAIRSLGIVEEMNKKQANTQINRIITKYDKTGEGSTKRGIRNNDWSHAGGQEDSFWWPLYCSLETPGTLGLLYWLLFKL